MGCRLTKSVMKLRFTGHNIVVPQRPPSKFYKAINGYYTVLVTLAVCGDLLHLLKSTFDRKRISDYSSPNPKAQ